MALAAGAALLFCAAGGLMCALLCDVAPGSTWLARGAGDGRVSGAGGATANGCGDAAAINGAATAFEAAPSGRAWPA